MRKLHMLAVAGFMAVGGTAYAQSAAYSPSARYEEPDAAALQAARGRVCKDPQVTLALEKVWGAADALYCAKSNYNGGSWANFNELVHAVGKVKADLEAAKIALYPAVINKVPSVVVAHEGKAVATIPPSQLDLSVSRSDALAVDGGTATVTGWNTMVPVPPTDRIVPAGVGAAANGALGKVAFGRFGPNPEPRASGKAFKIGTNTVTW